MESYWRLLRTMRPYRWIFLLGILGSVTGAGVDASLAWLIEPIINKGFIDQDMLFIQWLPVLIIGIFILRGGSSFTSSYFIARVGRMMVMDFRQRVFSHMLRLPADFYDKHNVGQLLAIL